MWDNSLGIVDYGCFRGKYFFVEDIVYIGINLEVFVFLSSFYRVWNCFVDSWKRKVINFDFL